MGVSIAQGLHVSTCTYNSGTSIVQTLVGTEESVPNSE